MKTDEELKTKVISHVKGKKWKQTMQKAIMGVEQRPDEDITKYWSRFDSMVNNSGKEQYTEAALIGFWIAGIANENIAMLMQAKEFTNLAEAFQAAESMEEVKKEKPSQPTSSTAAVMVVKEEKKCDHCGKTNHRTSSCWKC